MVPSDSSDTRLDPATIDPASITTVGDLRQLLYDHANRGLAMRVEINGELRSVLCDDVLLAARWLPDATRLSTALGAYFHYLDIDGPSVDEALEQFRGGRARDELDS
jgi:hypothetical protein